LRECFRADVSNEAMREKAYISSKEPVEILGEYKGNGWMLVVKVRNTTFVIPKDAFEIKQEEEEKENK